MKSNCRNNSFITASANRGCNIVNRLKRLLVLAALVMVVAPPTRAAEPLDPGLDKEIRRMLEISGAGNLGIQVMTQMVDSFKQSMPKVPKKFWDDFLKEARPQELVDLIVPAYARHFTQDDIKQFIAFYESPAGRKLVEKQPLVMRDSMAIGQEWGRALGEKIAKRLKDQGY